MESADRIRFSPAPSVPTNNQFLRSSAHLRIARSEALLSNGSFAFDTNCSSAFRYRSTYRTACPSLLRGW